MGTPYVGEIRLFAGSFAPLGWLMCDGATLPVAEFETLFMLIGTTYGGDGETTFALPNLCGRAPLHRSGTIPLGSSGGAESVTLTQSQLPVHNHAFNATTRLADQPTPGGNTTAQSGTIQLYTEDTPSVAFDPQALLPAAGGNQPHDNMHPFQVLNYIIAVYGIFPNPT